MKLIRYTLPLLWLTLGTTGMAETTVLVEAESFSELGGWVIDQQIHGPDGVALCHGSWTGNRRCGRKHDAFGMFGSRSFDLE